MSAGAIPLDAVCDMFYERGVVGRRRMVRVFVTLFALALVSVPRAYAGLESTPICCACEPASGPALFCARINEDQGQSTGERCNAQGGNLLCTKTPIGELCDFDGLDCPAAPAPAMGGRPLGALVALLGVVGVAAVRRRVRPA